MTNDQTADNPDVLKPIEPDEERVTPGAFVASATAESNSPRNDLKPCSGPAAMEALAGKIGLNAADMGAPPPQPSGGLHAVAANEDEPASLKTTGATADYSASTSGSLNPLGIGLGVLFYMAVAIGLAALSSTARAFMIKRWPWLLLAALVIVAVSAALATRRWFKKTTAQRRIGVIIFAVIPLVTAGVGAVTFLEVAYRGALLTSIFLLCVCLLPAVMYYLFIATKKYSILNEFIINLDRLGLLDAGGPNPDGNKTLGSPETEDERRNRILTYLQKFEAVYGAFPTDLGGLVLQPTDLSKVLYDRRLNKSEGSTFASIFTAETTVPVILATVLIALGWLITMPPWEGALPTAGPNAQQAQNWLHIFTPQKTPVHYAFLGAYFFSMQLLFRRYVRRDLRPSAYVAVSLRIILAVISTWIAVAAMGAMFERFTVGSPTPTATAQLLVLGFVIGVFPRVLWQLIRGAVKTFGGSVLRVPSLQTELPISQLDGLTVWHESRLEEEDIENVPNMATADLVDMLLNTRFPPDRIVDWVDQAILYTHLGPSKVNGRSDPRREALRTQGIRTASALIEAYNRSEGHNDLAEFEKILKDPGSSRSPIRSLVDTMQTNPNLRLIQTWRGLLPHSDRKQSAHLLFKPAG